LFTVDVAPSETSKSTLKLKVKKTGTTIAGVIFKDGVVLGADTRATSGEVVADKNCSKIHYITPNIYCCGAGTAADTEKTTDMLRFNLALQILSMGRNPRLIMASRILQDFLFRGRSLYDLNKQWLVNGNYNTYNFCIHICCKNKIIDSI
uniref:proteasome endopeptidase complex n=1 Tax=Sinocyclocheilus anshuiensis TaxID=1608454 RepID=A0A671N0J1_9TELE